MKKYSSEQIANEVNEVYRSRNPTIPFSEFTGEDVNKVRSSVAAMQGHAA